MARRSLLLLEHRVKHNRPSATSEGTSVALGAINGRNGLLAR